MPYTKIAPARLKPGHKGDLSYLVGQKLKACVVQVDTQSARKELVLSERQAAAAEALAGLTEGETVKGEVARLEDYGAIVALLNADGSPMGIQGLVHKKELSWEVVMTVEDVVKMGEGCLGGGGREE
jgi:ribosomal protein S1